MATNPIQIQKFLSGVDYPATRDDLIKAAREYGADEEILDMLEQLPDDEEYQTPTDVSEALSQLE